MKVPDKFIEKHGGYWDGSHRKATNKDWKAEVANDNTRMSYWEWAYTITEGE